MSSRAKNRSRATGNMITNAVKGVGAKWVRQTDRTYDVTWIRDTLREALTTKEKGPKIIVASSECMLNRQRREKPLMAKAIADGERTVKPRFGVDEDVCTGDHACMRLSGCPSLSVKVLDDPLRDDPVAAIDQNCVGCGNCGEVADAAVLCPSFYRADVIHNPNRLDQRLARLRAKVIGWLQERALTRAETRLPSSSERGIQTQRGLDSIAVLEPCSRLPPTIPSSSSRSSRSAGQGGGVVTDWIVDLAERNGWYAQSTSVPGVAQRTGATIYYVEMVPEIEGEADGTPVLSLMPAPGDVDIVLAAELMEAGRAMQRGLVTPDRTTLITSTHRTLAVIEKVMPGTGIFEAEPVLDAARKSSKRFLGADLEKLAAENGSVISASLFGALAGSGVLPFPRESFEATIAAGGRGAAQSLKAFGAGFAAVREARGRRRHSGNGGSGRLEARHAGGLGPGKRDPRLVGAYRQYRQRFSCRGTGNAPCRP